MIFRTRFVFFVALVVFLCVTTNMRSALYVDEITLWRDAAAKSPTKARPLTMVGLELQKLFDDDGARKCFERAVELEPDCPDALNNLAIIYGKSGNREKAVELLRRAVRRAPRSLAFRSNLAIMYYSDGKLDDSEYEYTYIIKLEPRSTEATFARQMLKEIQKTTFRN